MQTFLPTYDIPKIARILDSARLWKQVVEGKQIYLALTVSGYGWSNHPAVRMWRGSEHGLLCYVIEMADECCRLGIAAHTVRDEIVDWLDLEKICMPAWWGDPRVAASHRRNLLRKNFEYYSQFGWTDQPGDDYFWPV